MCYFMSSCAVKASKDDTVLVVQDVVNTENGATITFCNSDRTLQTDSKPFLVAGEVLLIKPDGQYVVLAKNSHFDFVMVVVMVVLAFLAGCLVTGRYVRRCLDGKNFRQYD